MRRRWLIIIFVIPVITSCSAKFITNKSHENIKFSNIDSAYRLTDLNGYGCEKIDASVIEHILRTGTLATEREVHDYYSTTGCSIRGSVFENGLKTDFTFDYGGIMYIDNGQILVCGKSCCNKNYSYCSYDPKSLKGVE